MNPGLVDVDALLREASELEPLPASTARLASLVLDESAGLAEVARIVRLDEALTGRLLGAANSAVSGPCVTILRVEEAVVRLGPGVVLSLVLGRAVGRQMSPALAGYELEEGALWRHSVAAALAVERSRRYCRRAGGPEAFAAALLHDVGKLVLSRHLSAQAILAVRAAVDQRSLSMEEAEREVLGMGHAALGARIARLWNLPETIASAIEHHHAPLDAPDDVSRQLCSLIQLADAVAQEVDARCGEDPHACFSPEIAGGLGISRLGFERLCEDVEEHLAEVMDLYGMR